MTEIRHWILEASAGHYFFYVFPIALLALFIWLKGRRVRFLIPSLIITIVIVNPLFYQKWQDLGLYAYWRILWVVPVIPVLAAVVPSITERAFEHNDSVERERNQYKNRIGRALITVAGIVSVVLSGTYIYHGDGGSFSRAENSAKLPNDVVAVADRLLELNEHPRIVADSGLSLFIREYSGSIDTLYGRDLYGFILAAGSQAQSVNKAVLGEDWNTVSQEMVDDDFDYLVTKNEKPEGFELIDTVGLFSIYSAIGKPKVIKERNELGQVIRITNVDENGNPVIGDKKYASITFEYDEYGRSIREFHTDTEGNGVPNLQGVAGYEKAYDDRSHVIMERMLGPDGSPIAGSTGYVEVRRVYEGNDLIREAYFDENEAPVNRIDTCYASVEMNYDEAHNRISEQYFDTDGNLTRASFGYAAVKRIFDKNRMIEEAYFDEVGAPAVIAAGYSGKKRTYDEMGNVTSESYFNDLGALSNCINGYARVEKEYDDEKNIIMQRFLDSDGHLVVTGSGYAEVHRIYQGEHLTRETYYGADGEVLVQPAGYCAIEQLWNADELTARVYLGPEGFPVNRTDGYARAVWTPGDNGTSIRFYDVDGVEVDPAGLNLATDITGDCDGWSDWMIPNYNALNSGHTIGYANLGTKVEGDVYTCQVEIEFKDVSATEGQTFWFRTQGAQDNRWFTNNVWNDGLITLESVPEDGVYTYTVSNVISGPMAGVSTFSLGFRCDYWASGAYRVRLVKIETGDHAGEWSPGV